MKVALVGRANVGKSSLFNRLVGKKTALISPVPGQTRDILKGHLIWNNKSIEIMDTGGYLDESPLANLVLQGMLRAAEEADIILLIIDGKIGPISFDHELAQKLRHLQKPIVVGVNKIDDYAPGREVEAYELGFESVIQFSALHGTGTGDLLDMLVALSPKDSVEKKDILPRLCIVGRPNAGKSTLLNHLFGQERVMVHEMPGTTRDPVEVRIKGFDQDFYLVDTAGIRRKKRMNEDGEKGIFSTVEATLSQSVGAFFLLDSVEGITKDDQTIAGMIEERGCACIIGLNKWDMVSENRGASIKEELKALEFISWAPDLPLSAMTGKGVDAIVKAMFQALKMRSISISQDALDRFFEEDIFVNPPPLRAGGPEAFHRLRYVSNNPPTFVVNCARPDKVHFSWRRHLNNAIRQRWGFQGNPIYINLKRGGGKRRS